MPCKHCHKPKLKQVNFEMGKQYRIDDETYICAQVGTELYGLISLSTGNRWNDPVDDIQQVARDTPYIITEVK